MNSIYNFLLTVFFCYFGLTFCQAQVNPATDTTSVIAIGKLHVLGKYYGDSIVLRWAPEEAQDWLVANEFGYRIERLDASAYDRGEIENAEVVAEVIRPYPLPEWTALLTANPSLRYPAIAMECIYGTLTVEEKGKGIADFFNQSNVLVNRHGFTLFAADVDQQAASLAGLRFVDNNIIPNKEYVYLVVPLAPLSVSKLRTGVVKINTATIDALPEITVSAEQSGSRAILSWSRAENTPHYSGYFIERAENRGSFVPLNTTPYVHGTDEAEKLVNPFIRFADSLTNEKSTFKYRVRGITPFADLGPWSETLKVKKKDLTPPASVSDLSVVFVEEKDMLLNWKSDVGNKDIKGYNVYYTYSLDRDFVKINKELISRKEQKYVHPEVNPYMDNYYYVTTVDKDGNEAKSIPVKAIVRDQTPPGIPQNIEATADTNGVVTLTWDTGKDIDILGFKIFFANAEYHEFSLITGNPITRTTFKDTITLKALDKFVYYKIMAVDKSFNYSPKSEIIKVKRPDIIPPSSPIFKDYRVTKNGIYLAWARSSSDDVVEHQLFRKMESDTTWSKYQTFYKEEKTFTDTDLKPNVIYQYKIQAVDDSGLKSAIVNPVSLKSQNPVEHPTVEKISAKLEKEENHISLHWEYPKTEKNTFLIFRKIEAGGFKTLTSVKGDINNFKDFDVQPGKTYKYCIKVLHDDVHRSKFGKIVTLKLP